MSFAADHSNGKVYINTAEWSDEVAMPIIAKVVEKFRNAFSKFPDVAVEDLKQIALMGCQAAWPKFNPALSSRTTFTWNVAKRRMQDELRSKERRLKRETVAGTIRAIAVEQRQAVRVDPHFNADDLVAWTASTYRTIRRTLSYYDAKPARRGRPHHYTEAQRMTLVALMNHRKLSCRGAAMLLDENPRLREVIELQRTPRPISFIRFKKSASQFI